MDTLYCDHYCDYFCRYLCDCCRYFTDCCYCYCDYLAKWAPNVPAPVHLWITRRT